MIGDQNKLAHLRGCGVPDREAEFIAAGVPDRPSVQAVRDFTSSLKTFCLLMGGAGSGKTIAAAEALLAAKMVWDGPALHERNWAYSPSEARFVLSSDLARMSYFELESQQRLWRLCRVPWLVIDDLGSELMTPGWASNLGELILQRNSGRRKTYITTNLGLDLFRERYDERIVSRIKGDGVVVAFGGEDLRRAP